MAETSQPARDSVAAQRELFRRAKLKGLSIAVLSKADESLKLSTLRGWASGDTAMPAWAIGALGEAGVPDHLLSLVTEPWRRCIVTEEDGDGDLDEAAEAAIDFGAAVQKARGARSAGGTAIVPQEVAIIQPKRQRALAALQRARTA